MMLHISPCFCFCHGILHVNDVHCCSHWIDNSFAWQKYTEVICICWHFLFLLLRDPWTWAEMRTKKKEIIIIITRMREQGFFSSKRVFLLKSCVGFGSFFCRLSTTWFIEGLANRYVLEGVVIWCGLEDMAWILQGIGALWWLASYNPFGEPYFRLNCYGLLSSTSTFCIFI